MVSPDEFLYIVLGLLIVLIILGLCFFSQLLYLIRKSRGNSRRAPHSKRFSPRAIDTLLPARTRTVPPPGASELGSEEIELTEIVEDVSDRVWTL